jgi:1-phosphofructokinase
MENPVDDCPAASVSVFTPSPLFTVTVERGARDDDDVHFHAGGQGFWVARMATLLGARAVLCGPFGGEVGPLLRQLIEAAGVRVRGTACSLANGGYVHDRRDGERRVVAQVDSPSLTRHEIDDLYGIALTTGLCTPVSVITGPAQPAVLAAEVFRRLALDLSSQGARVVVDLSGAALDALEGPIEVVKVSHEELLEGGLADGETPTALAAAVDTLVSRGAQNVIVSRAAAPALAYLERSWHEVHAPSLQPADHRGAGDSMTGGIAAALAKGLGIFEAVRLGAAAGAQNVTRHGLATGHREHVEALLDRIELRPWSP